MEVIVSKPLSKAFKMEKYLRFKRDSYNIFRSEKVLDRNKMVSSSQEVDQVYDLSPGKQHTDTDHMTR